MTTCPVCQTPAQGRATTCAVCGSPLGQTGVELAPGTVLAGGRYQIQSVLGQGGFGITYRARDQHLNRVVAIKEFFDSTLNSRRSKAVISNSPDFTQAIQGFLAEAQLLAQFNDPGIIKVFDTFRENGTAYYTMELLVGQTLEERISQQGRLNGQEVEQLALKLGQAISVVHQNEILHRDIKPANIFLTKDNRAVLIDFGSARKYQQGKTVAHTRLVTPGYAPLEQYQGQGKFGPYTDIYALSATLFHALTGAMPPDALSRLPQNAGGQGVPLPALPSDTQPGLAQALKRGLSVKATERPQQIGEFIGLLHSRPRQPSPPPPPAPLPSPAPPLPWQYRNLVGPSSDSYMRAFNELSLGRYHWHWSALLFGPFWLLYRKMYGPFLIVFIADIVFPGLVIINQLGLAIAAVPLYKHYLDGKLRRITRAPLYQQQRLIASQGGVHRWLPILGLALGLISILATFGQSSGL